MDSMVSAVIKLTDRCNLDCKYCYLERKANVTIDDETLRNIIWKFIDFNKSQAHFSWIGGEPLLLNNEFFQRIIELQERYNNKNILIKNSIQTNGLLLDLQRFDFLRGLGYKVGVSYDGTNELTDAQRISRSGRKFGKIISDRIDVLPRDVGIIGVLTKGSIGRAKKIYETLKDKTKSASLNLFVPSGNGRSTISELLATPEEMGVLLIELYKCWRDDEGDLMLHPFTSIVESFTSGRSSICEYSAASCYNIVSLDPDGKIYSCSRAVHREDCNFGNINEDSLDSVLLHPFRRRVLERMERLERECCEYFGICQGGCPQEALSTRQNEFAKTYYCQSKKMLFNHILQDIKNGL